MSYFIAVAISYILAFLIKGHFNRYTLFLGGLFYVVYLVYRFGMSYLKKAPIEDDNDIFN